MKYKSKLIKNEQLTVKRMTNNGYYDPIDGMPIAPEYSELTIYGNVQPVTGEELLQMEEGDRTRNVFNLFTETKLSGDDTVIRNDVEFEVRLNEDWDQQSLGHNFVRIVQKDV